MFIKNIISLVCIMGFISACKNLPASDGGELGKVFSEDCQWNNDSERQDVCKQKQLECGRSQIQHYSSNSHSFCTIDCGNCVDGQVCSPLGRCTNDGLIGTNGRPQKE